MIIWTSKGKCPISGYFSSQKQYPYLGFTWWLIFLFFLGGLGLAMAAIVAFQHPNWLCELYWITSKRYLYVNKESASLIKYHIMYWHTLVCYHVGFNKVSGRHDTPFTNPDAILEVAFLRHSEISHWRINKHVIFAATKMHHLIEVSAIIFTVCYYFYNSHSIVF